MNQNEFSTYDLNLSVVLITLGHELLELDKTNSRKVRFIFKKDKDIEEKVNDYFSNKIQLPVLELFNNQKSLKNRLYCNA